MACFVYEAMILFGIGLVPGAIGAVFTAQTGHRDILQSDTALRVIAFAIYAIYFVWLLVTQRSNAADADLAHPRRDARRHTPRPGPCAATLRGLLGVDRPGALLASALHWGPWRAWALSRPGSSSTRCCRDCTRNASSGTTPCAEPAS
jgi:uncharacterized membrane protein YfcA